MTKRAGFGHRTPCRHARIEEIRNGLDQVIGGQCSTCLAVLWGYGRCHGCGKDEAKLTHTIDGHRYCSEGCRRDELQRKRREPFSPPPPAGAAR